MRKHEPEFAIIAHDVPLCDMEQFKILKRKAGRICRSFTPKKGWLCPEDAIMTGVEGAVTDSRDEAETMTTAELRAPLVW